MRIAVRLISFFVSLLIFFPAQATSLSADQTEQETFNTDDWKQYDGFRIHDIQVHGTKWTKERAVLLLLLLHKGDEFSTPLWLKSMHKLYNTTVLYGIRTDVHAIAGRQIDIDIWVRDRWTLLPFGIAQGGGGSTDFGIGVWDANAFGYFTQLSASYAQFDHIGNYDLNLYQEFFLDTDFMGGLDFSNTGAPVTLESNSGSPLGTFIWERQQEQVLIGHRFEPKIRLFAYLETYQDHMVDKSQTPEVSVYQGTQYRFRPTLIWGRSDLTNFLEQGYELTLAPTTANFFNGERAYSQWVTTYKRTFISGNTNYAIFLNGGAMTSSPIPYMFHLGGYDTVRGFATTRVLGRYYLSYNLEYRPYLTRIDFPIAGEVVFQGCLFEDMGQMWNAADLADSSRVNSDLFMLSHGAGLRLNFQKFSQAIVRIDFAWTTIPHEGWGGGFGVGQFF